MSQDPWKNGNFVQHEFGCGVRVRFEKVEFTDGLKIWIPREADNSVHDCPKLPNNPPYPAFENLAEVYTPEDPDLFDEWFAAEWAPWDKQQLIQHLEELDRNFAYCPNLEFKNTRQREKEFLVENLEATSHFYFHLTLGEGAWDEPVQAPIPLPPCLDLWDEDGVGTFSPLELLGLFYEMDGALLDARRCFEINLEMGWDAKWCQNKIDQINKNIADIEEEKLRQKSAADAIKNVITPQQEAKSESEIESDSRKVEMEIRNFEKKDLKEYVLAKIPKEELIKQLKTDVLSYRTKIVEGKKKQIGFTLYDLVKKFQAKEETRKQVRKNPIAWDYLSFGQKIKVLTSNIKKNEKHNRNCLCEKCEFEHCLWRIKEHRDVLAHTGEYYMDNLELVNQSTRLDIKKCQDYFEKSKNV